MWSKLHVHIVYLKSNVGQGTKTAAGNYVLEERGGERKEYKN